MKHEFFATNHDYQVWSVFRHDYIHNFIVTLSVEDQKALDFSIEALNIVEAWLLNKFPNLEAFFEGNDEPDLDGIMCYIGETFRKNLGGKWGINLDNPDEDYYQIPVIINSENVLIPIISPLHIMIKAINKHMGSYSYMRITLVAFKQMGQI